MFHWVHGIPFEFNAGAYDHLNMWEQIDNGDQYTPTKKFLLMVPIVLYAPSCPCPPPGFFRTRSNMGRDINVNIQLNM